MEKLCQIDRPSMWCCFRAYGFFKPTNMFKIEHIRKDYGRNA